jgi:uracil-DNA glycosylase
LKLYEALPQHWRDALGDEALILNDIQVPDDFIPEFSKIFRAFELPISELKICILGQDPYPNPEDAMGIAFSVNADRSKLPATLRNIFKELETDYGIKSVSGDLSPWHKQGVFLLNRVLTTKNGYSNSHKDLGWQKFTESVIKLLAKEKIVFILWGESAGEVEPLLNPQLVIRSVHPSPLSAYRGFFGSKPFSRANLMLKELGFSEIDWRT